MSDVLKDPLIRQMLRADKVSLDSFAAMLKKAAQERARKSAESGWQAARKDAASSGQTETHTCSS
jgi:hypothetical protein